MNILSRECPTLAATFFGVGAITRKEPAKGVAIAALILAVPGLWLVGKIVSSLAEYVFFGDV